MRQVSRSAVTAACLLAVQLVQTQAQAQTPPEVPAGVIPSAEELKRGQEAARPAPAAEAELPAAAPAPRELGKPSDDITLDVSGYRIDGLPGIAREDLAKVTAPYVGKGKNYEDLVNAAAAVTRYMQRELGYYLGYAYLPEQSPENGEIRIVALEGRLDQVILRWPDKMPIRREVVERYLAALKPGEILHVREVERVVFLINDLQGLRARFEVKAGRVPGTASLVVTPQAESRTSGRTEFDVNGSRYSGLARISGLLTVASPTGSGDALVFNVLNSVNNRLSFGLVSYVLPLGSNGFKLGASASLVHYHLSPEEIPLDLAGRAQAANVFALYPLIRSRNLNTFALATYEHKKFTDERFGGASRDVKSSDDVQLGVVGDFRDNIVSGGVNTYEAAWTNGHVDYSKTLVPPQDTPSSFNKVTLGFSRLQNLIGGRLLAYVRYKGQLTDANLDTTERFSLGGPQAVRAFAPGEATGDEGHLFTGELRFLPPESWFGRSAREMVFSAFYDFGIVKFRHQLTGVSLVTSALNPLGNDTTLSGFGLGAIWDRPQSFGLRVNLSWPINGDPQADPSQRRPRAYATLTKYF